MAEKDIIARLKVEGQVDFINSMNQSADAVGNLDINIQETAQQLATLTDELRDSIKSGKGVAESMKKLDDAIDGASQSIAKASKNASDAQKMTDKLDSAYQELVDTTSESSKVIDKMGDASLSTSKDLAVLDKQIDTTNTDLYNLGANFEDIYGTLKPLTSRLGEMEDRMYELALAGKQNTDEFKALNAESIRFRKTQIEVDKAVDALADSGAGIRAVSEGISGLAGAFAVSQGALALFGDENESLEKALIKLNAVMAISSGIQQVNENLLQKNAFTTKVAAAAQSAYAFAVGTSTGAMKLFRLALIATGLGAIVVVIGAVIANWDKLSKAISESIPWLKNFGDAWTSVKDNFLAFFRSFGTIAVEIGKIALSLGKTIAMAIAEPWNVGDIAKKFVKDVTDGLDAINEKYSQQKKIVVENRMEQERIDRVQKTILGLETAILKARANNAKESTVISLQLQKARAELSLLVVGSNEYYEKQIEINSLLKSSTKELKSANDEIKAQIGSVTALQERYNKLVEIANKAIPGSKQQTDALREASQLLPKIEKEQEKINNALEQGKQNTLDTIEFKGLEVKATNDAVQAAIDGVIQEHNVRLAQKRVKKQMHEDDLKRIKEEREARMQAAELELQKTNQLASMAFDVFSQFNNAQKIALENRLKQGLISEEQYNRELAKINEKQAKADKAKALFDATINGASAIISAYRIGLPFAIVVGALVAAQIAAIAATPIPKFFKGVIGLQRGKNPKGRDTIPAMLNEGESVMTTEETKQHRPVLEAIRNKTFDKMYIRRGKMEQRTLSSIVNFSGSKKNKKLEKKERNKLDAKVDETNMLLRQMMGIGIQGNNIATRNIKEFKKIARNKINRYA